MNKETTLTCVSRLEDFGMKYRGRWIEYNTYNVSDVVWKDLGEPKLDGETYFVCIKEHIADQIENVEDQTLWRKWR